jgi:hypothetical protein
MSQDPPSTLLTPLAFVFPKDEQWVIDAPILLKTALRAPASPGVKHAAALFAQEYVRRIIAHCALSIKIPTIVGADLAVGRNLTRLFAPSLRSRVSAVDPRRSRWSAVVAYFEPILGSWPPDVAFGMERAAVSSLRWQVYMFALACKHKCEVLLSPQKVLDLANYIESAPHLSSESRARLAVIESLFASYVAGPSLPCLRFYSRSPGYALIERLDEILEDAYLLEASQLRRFLGFRQNIASVTRDLRRVLNHIVRYRSWAKGALRVATESTFSAAPLSSLPELAAPLLAGASVSAPTLLPFDATTFADGTYYKLEPFKALRETIMFAATPPDWVLIPANPPRAPAPLADGWPPR